MNRAFISALMVISLVSALVSPACAFMSGSTAGFIEICTSNGEVEIIAVPGNQAPTQQNSAHKAQPDCAFCFAGSDAKTIGPQDIKVLKLSSSYTKVSAGVFAPQGLTIPTYRSRAPPLYRS